jgi:hypothetical protein
VPDWLSYVLLAASAFAAGGINAIAGGGTLVTFPTLLALGFDPKLANGTSTVALWPWSLGSAYGYRDDLRHPSTRRTFAMLSLPSLCGGTLGTALVVWTPSEAFARLCPYLILAATILFALSPRVAKRASDPGAAAEPRPTALRRIAITVGQFAIAIYGGYFGAGLGILMLALLARLRMESLHHANAVKALLGMLVNGAAAIVFMATGLVAWPAALAMGAAAMLGGFAGARLAKRLPARGIRAAIVLLGIAVGVTLLIRVQRI